VEFNKKTIQVISEKIGVKPQDFEYWIGKLIDITNTRANPKDIEIVKIWKVYQLSPQKLDWWEILIFDPIGGENGNEYYELLDINKWNEVAEDEDNIAWIDGNTKPIDLSNTDDRIVELIFESDIHIPEDYTLYSQDFFY